MNFHKGKLFCIFYAAVNCEWNEWSIGSCSTSCGGGQRKKTRTKRIVENFGGSCNGLSSVTELCNTVNCPG